MELEPIIYFSQAEMDKLRKLAEIRNHPAKRKGFVNPRQDRTYSHLLGLMGEAAIAWWFDLPLDERFLMNGDGNVMDFQHNGKRIQVKTTSRFTGDLIFSSPEAFKADIAILVYADPKRPAACIKGWTVPTEFAARHFKNDYGHGECAAMASLNLWPIRDLRIKPQYTQDAQDLRDAYEERAAILEYEAGYSRAMAERLARQAIYGR